MNDLYAYVCLYVCLFASQKNDDESDTCLLCRVAFSMRIRRHHCRVCYRLVCGNCSPHTVELNSSEGPARVCNECFLKLGQGKNSSGVSSGAFKQDNDDQIHLKLFVHSAENLAPATDIGFLGTDATRCAYAIFTLEVLIFICRVVLDSANARFALSQYLRAESASLCYFCSHFCEPFLERVFPVSMEQQQSGDRPVCRDRAMGQRSPGRRG